MFEILECFNRKSNLHATKISISIINWFVTFNYIIKRKKYKRWKLFKKNTRYMNEYFEKGFDWIFKIKINW